MSIKSVLADVSLMAVCNASARTVSWSHFNEGASGETAAGGQPVVLNAVDPTSLTGTPYALTDTRTPSTTGNLPVYTNDMPSCVSWFDPVSGESGNDNRSLYLKCNDGKSSRPMSAVLVNDDENLHCQHITVEMMIKSSPGAASQHKSGDWLHALTMLSSGSSNTKAWGIMLNGDGRAICTINNSSNAFNGSGTSGAAGGGGGNGYLYSAAVGNGVPKITDGKWHHVAMTYDGTTVRLYVDYAQRGYLAWSGPLVYDASNAGKLCIGGNYGSNYGGWDGFIDEVRISDEALTPEKFLRVSEISGPAASDTDTAIYLPFNTLDAKDDPFFFNSACSTNASLISMQFSTSGAGIWPCIETGAADVVSNELHAGVFAADTIANTGCWRFTNTLANASSAYHGKARNIWIDDFSRNNGQHLISSGDFTAECWIKVPVTPVLTRRILFEDCGSNNVSTIQLYVNDTWLYCRLCPQDQFDKYQAGEIAYSSISWKDWYMSVNSVTDGNWHHIALVVDHTNQKARFYLDRQLVLNREISNFTLASEVYSSAGNYRYLKIGDGGDGNNKAGLQDVAIDEFRITRRALAPQEFLLAGASVSLEPTRAWIGFEGDLSVEPSEGAIPEGSIVTNTVTMEYAPVVPGFRLVDGYGNVIREANTLSMRFSGALDGTSSQRLFFSRNMLLENDMKSMTVEFFMKGTKNEAIGWTTILRMYGNATGSDSSPFRRLWSVGYSNTAGNLYVIKDINGASQATFYPDNTVSLADGKWHHIAVTFAPDGNGNTLCNVYKDYQQLGSEHTFNGELECGDYGTSSMAAGSRYNGYLDEIRISKGVLTVDQMMHVIKRGTMISIQ